MSKKEAKYHWKLSQISRDMRTQLNCLGELHAIVSELHEFKLLNQPARIARIFKCTREELIDIIDTVACVAGCQDAETFFTPYKYEVRDAHKVLTRNLRSKAFNTMDERCKTPNEKADADAIYDLLESAAMELAALIPICIR